MYQFLAIPDFAKAGLNSDLQPWDLPPSFLTDINNIRVIRNQVQAFAGYTEWADLPSGFNPGFLMPVGSTSSDKWIIAGTPGVYAFDGDSFDDISSGPYPGINDPSAWNGCMLSRIPILNNIGHYPEYWQPQDFGIDLQPLPWSLGQTWDDANQQARIIRSHKQFLLALDLVDNGVEIPDGVQWSAPADINGVPGTWDFLDTTNVAGRTTLGGDGGDIIDGLSLRDAFCVYRESGITIFDFVPNSPYIWQIRQMSSTAGCVSENSIVEVKGRHFVIGDGDIFVNDGNDLKSLLHNRLRKRFNNEYNPETYRNSFALRNNVASEVWFCVPGLNATYPTVAYIYNWRDDSWAIRDIPEGTFANYGTVQSPNLTWDTVEGTWDTTSLTWQRRQATPLDDTIVQCVPPNFDGQSAVGKLLFLDKTSEVPDQAYRSVIERTGIPLGGLNRVTTITTVYPHITGPTPVFIEIGSQDFPGSPVRWKPGVTFNPETDRKVDVRTTGELHCFRISSESQAAQWSVSGIDVEFVQAGAR